MVKNSPTSRSGKATSVGKPPSGRPSSAERLTTPAKVGKSGVAPRADGDGPSDQGGDETMKEDEWEMKPEPDEVKTVGKLQEQVEDLQAFLGHSGTPQPVARNLARDLAAVGGDDDDEGLPAETKLFEGNVMPRVPVDTPTANLLLGRLADRMRTESAWMMMFSPVPMAQATWINVWPVAKAPIDSSSLQAVVRETQAFLKSIGFRCNAMPSLYALGAWTAQGAGSELLKWKKYLRQVFEKENEARVKKAGLTDSRDWAQQSTRATPPAPRKGKSPTPRDDGRFRATVGSPYFEDSHMLPSPRSGREEHDEGVGEYEDDDGGSDDLFDESDNDSLKDDGAQRPRRTDQDYSKGGRRAIEVRTHAPLRKIEMFGGRRDKSEASMQWLKRFVYEMKGTKMPRDTWCEPFSLCLTEGAKSWYGQLSKRTQNKWNLLCDAFLETYCSQYDQDPNLTYYHASRKPSEHLCDYLYRLNGYARKARIQYTSRGRVGKSHVEQFLLSCGDDDLADQLFPLGLDDITQVERMVMNQLKGKRGQKLRECQISGGRSRSRDDDRRGESRRDDRKNRDKTRDYGAGSRQETSRARVMLADVSLRNLREELNDRERTVAGLSDSEGSESVSSENDSSGEERGRINSATQDETPKDGRYYSPTQDPRYTRRQDTGRFNDRGDRGDQRPSRQGYGGHREGRRSDREDRSRFRDRDGQETCASCSGRNHSAHNCWKRCKFCGQVHQPAQCEQYQPLEKLTALLKSTAEKGELPDELKTALSDHLN